MCDAMSYMVNQRGAWGYDPKENTRGLPLKIMKLDAFGCGVGKAAMCKGLCEMHLHYWTAATWGGHPSDLVMVCLHVIASC